MPGRDYNFAFDCRPRHHQLCFLLRVLLQCRHCVSPCDDIDGEKMSAVQIEKILSEPSPHKLLTYLRKQTADSFATTAGHDPLDLLNPAEHSLAYLFIL